jgi:hypothetical protein
MRAVKDGLPAPSGDSEETEDPRWTRAVGDDLAIPHRRASGALAHETLSAKQSRQLLTQNYFRQVSP